jgi:RHH-type rel operon transcriptional repressor/antitoxin RelB
MPVSIRLHNYIEARLKNLADLTGRTKSFYIIEAICRHLDGLEDVYLTERELEAIRAGTSQTVPLEEVMREYGLRS